MGVYIGYPYPDFAYVLLRSLERDLTQAGIIFILRL